LTAPKTPWVGNTVRLGSLRWVAQSNYWAQSSRRLVRIEAEWSSIHSRMHCFLWEAAQQHACTMYQALLQTPLVVPAIGKVKRALAALEK
jgi:hypothetical protein